ncbi:MAG: class I SAM-dependent methyltransferase [Chloroflexi bacterium]|nr:class I SAM-dependent methyltransferase [Chloroflexota bacterium]
MTHYTREFYNEMWTEHGDLIADADAMLIAEVEGLTPGRALDIGCGVGGNAVWLAERGWQVTATDFADVAIEKCKQLAARRRVQVEFVVADATTFQPDGQYDFISSFYIQLPPDQRAKMLSIAAGALAPGGTLLFVSHDSFSSPSEETDEDTLTLTTPDEVVSELPGLKIEKAFVMEHESGEHTAHAHDSEDGHNTHERLGSHGSGSIVVRAVRLAQ